MKNSNYNKKITDIIIDKKESVLFALKKMDEKKKKLLLVFDEDNFYGLLSIGDIQRGILSNIDLKDQIHNILRNEFTFAYDYDSLDEVKEKMLKFRTECMPLLSKEGDLIDVYFWEDVFGLAQKRKHDELNLPVVIMAGGKGTRLKPITNVIPKPLIPLGDNTIIEEIMNRFINVGCNNFYLSVNYKAETIKHYFEQLNNERYSIDYFQETKPLGTAGSLSLIKGAINSTFFVSNCDIIIDEDYTEVLKYHRENKNELTLVSVLNHYPIPYGTIETAKNGVLTSLIEKPELTFQINSGMYILEPHLLQEIPENSFFHITDLIENIQKRGGKVGVFPVSSGSWTDIGTWEDFLKESRFKGKD